MRLMRLEPLSRPLKPSSFLLTEDSKTLSKETISQFQGAVVKCEPPNKRLYQFTGNLYLKGNPEPVSISPASILLRGCILRNTNRALGVVIYAGHDTKAGESNAPTRLQQQQFTPHSHSCRSL